MLKRFLKFQSRVDPHDLSRFCRSLGILLRAGVPLEKALLVLKGQFTGRMREVCRNISADVSGGSSFIDSLSNQKVFPAPILHLCSAGEAVAELDRMLIEAAGYLEDKAKFSSDIKGALAYPVIVMSFSIITLVVLVIFVLPVFEDLYSNMGVGLPFITSFFLAISRVLRGPLFFILLAALIAAVYFAYKFKTKNPYQFEEILFGFPVLGIFFSWTKLFEISRSFSVLLSGGVPLADSIDLLGKNSESHFYKKKLLDAHGLICQGRSLSEAGGLCKLFDQTGCSLIAIGEESGELAMVFNEAAEFYRIQIDRVTKRFIKLLEPAVTLGVGGVVMMVAAAMLLPMVNLVSSLSR